MLYKVDNSGSMGIVSAPSLQAAISEARADIGRDHIVNLQVCLATQEDLDWYQAMGGIVPKDVYPPSPSPARYLWGYIPNVGWCVGLKTEKGTIEMSDLEIYPTADAAQTRADALNTGAEHK